jgi:hypothetical protein
VVKFYQIRNFCELAARDRLESRMLRLLKEDEEFRYAVAGLIGLEEILRRSDRHEEEIAKLREEILEESRTVRKEDGDQARKADHGHPSC